MKLFQVRNLNLPSTPEGCAYRRILGTFQFVSDFYCGCWELQRLRFRRWTPNFPNSFERILARWAKGSHECEIQRCEKPWTWPQIPQIFFTWKRQKYNLKDKAARKLKDGKGTVPKTDKGARSPRKAARHAVYWVLHVSKSDSHERWNGGVHLFLLQYCFSSFSASLYIIVLLFDIDTEYMCKIINMCISTSFL